MTMSVISDPTSVSDHSLLSRKHPRSSNTTTRLLLGYGFCKAWRDRTEGCLHQPTATIRQWNHYGRSWKHIQVEKEELNWNSC